MRRTIQLATVLGILVGCAPDPRSEAERLADAARADSSAAGYDVGASAHQSGGANGSRGRGRARVIQTVPSTVTAAGNGMTSTQPVSPSGTNGDGSSGRGVAQPGAQPSPASALASVTTRIDTSHGGVRPPAPIREADFLAYDSATKALTFQLSAGADSSGLVSFNGAVRGTRVLTVPRGWTVTISFVNRDSLLPHSAVVVEQGVGIPEELPVPTFVGAGSARLRNGLLNGSTEELEFVADREGKYLLACGVFAHAQRGQWIGLVVSGTAAAPSYR